MIDVKSVVRQDRIAKQVTISSGAIEITYIILKGKLKEIARINREKQVLDRESLFIPPADYQEVIKTANAILFQRRKVPTS